MKHLLTLLIFVAINCKAQNTYTMKMKMKTFKESGDICFSITDSGSITIFDTACTISWLLEKQLKSTIKVSDFIEYEEVCYNDSVLIYTTLEEDTTRVPINKQMFYAKEIKHFTHRKPTFEGFLIFINKRYGK